MRTFPRSWFLRLAVGVALAAAGTPPVEVTAQQAFDRVALLSHPDLRASDTFARGDYLIVVDLDTNFLHFMQGRTILWSAPVGTGMGLRLQTGDRKWTFSTPTGAYQIQYKEQNPVWIAPDWYFIENKLPVPPQDDARRRMPGALGAAAVHFGRGLAIHGTDKPDLLGQRVSHGCIRIANEFALRLFHNVQIGTKVLIIGEEGGEQGELVPGQVPGAGPVDARTQRMRERVKAERAALLRELRGLSTEELVARLGSELDRRDAAGPAARWPETASVLIHRATRDGDQDAARGVLELAAEGRNTRVRAELATFVVDLYARGSPAVALALAEMPARAQSRVAELLVDATIALFDGDADQPIAPWPTRRILRTSLDADAQPGWDAIHRAERAYRERHAAAGTAPRTGRIE